MAILLFQARTDSLTQASQAQNISNLLPKAQAEVFLISSFMRYILFLAAVGIVSQGIHLDKNNPAATIFESAAGRWGLFVFGIVLWSAAISSVIGASYTSYSFIKIQKLNCCKTSVR